MSYECFIEIEDYMLIVLANLTVTYNFWSNVQISFISHIHSFLMNHYIAKLSNKLCASMESSNWSQLHFCSTLCFQTWFPNVSYDTNTLALSNKHCIYIESFDWSRMLSLLLLFYCTNCIFILISVLETLHT